MGLIMVAGAALLALIAIVMLLMSSSVVEAFTQFYNKRSSCYSCERDFPPDERWRAQPSKCFSCERQLAATPGADPFTASRTVW